MAFQLAKAQAFREALLKDKEERRQTFAQVVSRNAHQVSDKAPLQTAPRAHPPVFNAQHPLRTRLNDQKLGVTAHKAKKLLQDEDGWTTVSRRKHVTPKRNPYLSPQQRKLKEGNKCFNCFSKGHKKAGCKNQVRCINCEEPGHISRFCPKKFRNKGAQGVNTTTNQVKTQPIVVIKEKQKEQPKFTFPKVKPLVTPQPQTQQFQPNYKENNMDMPDWETIELTNPDQIEVERAEDMEVFINPRHELLPPNMFLYRTTIVLAGPNPNDKFLAHKIAIRLASHFKMQPRDFKVRKAHHSVGDFLAIFPTYDMMKEATDMCVFMLGPGIEVQLTEWTNEAGMLFDPSSNLARVKLLGVPYKNWNKHDVADIVSGFGTLQKMALVSDNENYEYIHALVDCHRPKKVPRYLTARAGSYYAPIEVELEGWFHTTEPEPQVVRRDHNRDDRSTQNSSIGETRTARRNAAPYQRTRPAATRDYAGPSGSHRRRHGHGGEEKDMTVQIETTVAKENGEGGKEVVQGRTTGEPMFTVTSFQIAHAEAGMYGELMVTSNLGELFKIAILSSHPRAVRGMLRETIGTFSSDWPQKSSVGLLGKRHAINAPTVLASKEPNAAQFMGPLLTQGRKDSAPPTLITTAHTGEILNTAGPIIYLGPAMEKQKDPNLSAPTEPFFTTDPALDNDTTTTDDPNPPPQNETSPSNTSAGSPPGFPGPPRYTRGPIRHSARLSAKHNGVYISPEERARLVSKPYALSFHKKRQARKRNPSPVKLDYMKSFAPLTDSQAEVIILQAGISLSNELEQVAREAIATE